MERSVAAKCFSSAVKPNKILSSGGVLHHDVEGQHHFTIFGPFVACHVQEVGVLVQGGYAYVGANHCVC